MRGPCILSCITLIGTVSITEDGDGNVTGVYLPNSNLPCMDEAETDILLEAADQLNQYFSGKRRDFDLPLSYDGSEFRVSVLDALRDIPYGETRTYGQIAAQIGRPTACRAVGMANNRNPIAIVVPCHRVVGSTGALVGYAGGLGVKTHLLNLEKAHED